MAAIKRLAPIFPVGDLAAATAHYEGLGFAVRAYAGGGYAYATRDGIEIHLTATRGHTAQASTSAAYLWVDDADSLARDWRASGAEVRDPVDTEWGLHEGVHLDPDGNLIRFGSPIARDPS
jgi:predicted lactoylglutathione lyase